MIRSLTLENFRRHAKTEIEFGAEAQIIAISGRNGMGKTTILEAILMALYGETRHGRRGLAGVVRRGAEHEGMGVECTFDVAGTLYKVTRRYEKGKHSAALYANNNLHTQTADGVTAAITALLGMDSVGFKLATIAKQKELDGLAEMTASVRRKTISRLLRLDAVQAAQLAARDKQKNAKAAAVALAGAANAVEKAEMLDAARQTLTEVEGAWKEAVKAVEVLDTEIGKTSEVEELYRAAQLQAGKAEAARDAAYAEHQRAVAALNRHTVPATHPEPAMGLQEANQGLLLANEQIAQGTAQSALQKQLEASTRRLEDTKERLADLQTQADLLSGQDFDKALTDLQTSIAGLNKKAEVSKFQLESLTGESAKLSAKIDEVKKKLRNLDTTGPTCDTCGQEVGDEHRETSKDKWVEEVEQSTKQLHTVDQDIAAQKQLISDISDQIKTHQSEAVALQQKQTTLAQLTERITEGRRAQAVYEGDISRLQDQVQDIDLEAAYANKTKFEAAKAEAENAAHAALVRQGALVRQQELEETEADAAVRLSKAQAELDAAMPDKQLVEAFSNRQQLIENRKAEQAFLDTLSLDKASLQAKVEAAEKALEEANQVADKIAKYRTEAEIAAKTATLLEGVSKRLATQIRPQLEGHITSLLQQMSEGRFTAASVSEDYEVTICDHDGRFYPVSEFSGGEADLIALAIRLALAQVVAARHGAGGAGFLILDEVFGSQDETRRYAIMEALRRLRGTYGQILLISHVGGIEDVADMVLDVNRNEEEEVAQVAILAG